LTTMKYTTRPPRCSAAMLNSRRAAVNRGSGRWQPVGVALV
jgi:hypothetical protein